MLKVRRETLTGTLFCSLIELLNLLYFIREEEEKLNRETEKLDLEEARLEREIKELQTEVCST